MNNVGAADAANYSVTLANSAGNFATVPTAATVWSPVNPTIQFGQFNSVASSGTVYAAVGSNNIYTSSNGQNWVAASNFIPNTLRSVTYATGKFVAVGSDGIILVSPDNGVTWNTVTSGTTNQLNGVVHDGTRFVAVGAASTVV